MAEAFPSPIAGGGEAAPSIPGAGAGPGRSQGGVAAPVSPDAGQSPLPEDAQDDGPQPAPREGPGDGPEDRTPFGRGFLYDLWYFAAMASDLRPGRLTRLEILGQPVLLGRPGDGAAFALRDICPHRAAPLSAGRLTEDAAGEACVQCPYHGWSFRAADGVCVDIPSLVPSPLLEDGRELSLERIRVRAYPVRESQGLIFVFMAEDPRAGPPASGPPLFDGMTGGRPRIIERLDFRSHVDHAVVGLMDPTHGPYVHQQWWWRSSSRQIVKAKAFEPRELGFAMVRHAPSRNSRAYRLLGGAPETEITFRLPGYRWEHVRVGRRQVLALTCLTPLDAQTTRITQIIWSDHWAFRLLILPIRAGARAFLRQDADMVNLQNEGLRFDPALLWIDDADRQAKWYQSLKRAWTTHRRSKAPFVNPVEAAVLRWRS